MSEILCKIPIEEVPIEDFLPMMQELEDLGYKCYLDDYKKYIIVEVK